MLSVVDLVVPYNGAAVGSDLDSRQGVTIDIVTLYQTPSISKYVHPSLVTVEYSVSPENITKKTKQSAMSTLKYFATNVETTTQIPICVPL